MTIGAFTCEVVDKGAELKHIITINELENPSIPKFSDHLMHLF